MPFSARPASWRTAAASAVLAIICGVEEARAESPSEVPANRSIADRSMTWPAWSDFNRVLTLQDYNTRIVIIGTTLLGCACGMVGSFTLLRKRALMGDALSHATLPGIAFAFILSTRLGHGDKSLAVLLAGATISGLLGMAVILALGRLTRLKEDTALGAVLSVFFGAGVALLGVIQQMTNGHAAGLESFIYGKTASMGIADIQLIATAATICIAGCLILFKELKLLCFDDDFAASRGYPVVWLDIGLMALVVIVTIVGLQAVGLILMIALLIIPAAAARFWTESLGRMFAIAGAIGAASGLLGAAASASFARLPSGAMIVLVCTTLFVASMVFGSARGILLRTRKRTRLNRSVDRQHLLRALYELLEASQSGASTASPASPIRSVDFDALLRQRSWSKRRLRQAARRAKSARLIEWIGEQVRFTKRGEIEAARLTRQHRLWELYLITHADVAPGRVDRDADAIEHVLEPDVVAELEALLEQERVTVPQSPHTLHGTTATSTIDPGRS